MTIAGLVLSTIGSTIIFGLFKFVFFAFFDNPTWAVTAGFWLGLVIVATAIVRRLGIINYAEAILLTVVWLLFGLLLDGLLVSRALGGGLLKSWLYWLSHLVIMLSVLLFHKKVHTKIDLTKYR